MAAPAEPADSGAASEPPRRRPTHPGTTSGRLGETAHAAQAAAAAAGISARGWSGISEGSWHLLGKRLQPSAMEIIVKAPAPRDI